MGSGCGKWVREVDDGAVRASRTCAVWLSWLFPEWPAAQAGPAERPQLTATRFGGFLTVQPYNMALWKPASHTVRSTPAAAVIAGRVGAHRARPEAAGPRGDGPGELIVGPGPPRRQTMTLRLRARHHEYRPMQDVDKHGARPT